MEFKIEAYKSKQRRRVRILVPPSLQGKECLLATSKSKITLKSRLFYSYKMTLKTTHLSRVKFFVLDGVLNLLVLKDLSAKDEQQEWVKQTELMPNVVASLGINDVQQLLNILSEFGAYEMKPLYFIRIKKY